MSGYISKEIAQKIVDSHKSYFHHDITFMDTSGCIIACTNSARVGSIHGGAVKMFKENLDTLNIRYDSEYPGTLHGVNKMIYRYGKPVGVVGITGNVTEVEPFGEIIKKMTELLLVENERLKEESIRRRNVERFIGQWLEKENNSVDPLFIQQGLSLGVNILLPRRVIIMSIVRQRKASTVSIMYDNDFIDALREIIRKQFGHDYQNIWLLSGNRVVFMITEDDDEEIRARLSKLKETVRQETDADVYFGCDEVSTSGKDTYFGYLRAMNASATASPDNWLRFYKNVDLDLVIESMQDDAKREFLYSVFKDSPASEIMKWRDFINVYAEENGSITNIGKRLFLHKNSVQSRIMALEKLTGYDCRKYTDFAILYIAARITALY